MKNAVQTTSGPDLPTKSAYTPPVLRVFGSIGTLTLGGAGLTCDGVNSGSNNPKTGSPPICVSDRSVKHFIKRVGTHPAGFGLFLFDYKPEYQDALGHGRQFGVMADEVERVVPAAVSVHPSGCKQVDYAMLQITRYLN